MHQGIHAPSLDLARQSGGHATLWRVSQAHGAADFEAGFQSPLSPALATISQRLQQQFDPHGVFRTQRLSGASGPLRVPTQG